MLGKLLKQPQRQTVPVQTHFHLQSNSLFNFLVKMKGWGFIWPGSSWFLGPCISGRACACGFSSQGRDILTVQLNFKGQDRRKGLRVTFLSANHSSPNFHRLKFQLGGPRRELGIKRKLCHVNQNPITPSFPILFLESNSVNFNSH